MLNKGRNLKKNDEFNTPLGAWKDILQYVSPETDLWLPFYNDGSCTDLLKSLDYKKVFHVNLDFFVYNNPGLIIDNPPWSKKQKIIAHLYEQTRPFALLLPLAVLEYQYIRKFQKHLQIVIPKDKYSFIESGGKPPFKSCWFCWRFSDYLGTKKDLIFL